jgi:hypothetical protein
MNASYRPAGIGVARFYPKLSEAKVLFNDDFSKVERSLLVVDGGIFPEYRSDLKCIKTVSSQYAVAKTPAISVSGSVVVNIETAHVNSYRSIKLSVTYKKTGYVDKVFRVDVSEGVNFYEGVLASSYEFDCLMGDDSLADSVVFIVEFGNQPAVYLYKFSVEEGAGN